MTELLNLLESLLSITERFKREMDHNDCDEWQRISAKCADISEEYARKNHDKKI
jgi:hypothetical protein